MGESGPEEAHKQRLWPAMVVTTRQVIWLSRQRSLSVAAMKRVKMLLFYRQHAMLYTAQSGDTRG